MLRELTIKDLAVVESLHLTFESGLTVLTGETGAGKSILLTALGLALGDRADPGFIRGGAPRAEIALRFDLDDCPRAQAWLEEQALLDEEGCLIRRVISSDGRSKAFVNGSPVTLQSLQELGQGLLEIHGQHAHVLLVKGQEQRRLLDAAAGNGGLLRELSAVCHELKEVKARLEAANSQQHDRAARLDLLTFQLDELQLARMDALDYEVLVEDHGRQAHAERILEVGQRELDNLYEDEASSVTKRLAQAIHGLGDIGRVAPEYQDLVKSLEEAEAGIKEAASDLRRLLSRQEADPRQLALLEERLADVHRLARKHQVRPEALKEHVAVLEAERAALMDSGTSNAQWALRRQELEAAYREQAAHLSLRRKEAARLLEGRIQGLVAELGMPKARLRIEVVADEEAEPTLFGQDQVEFLVSANPGLPLKPLARVASGGELSRISLAIQVALTGEKGTPTMIFDEVDSGIGGGVAEVVGQKLRLLGGERQIFSVTHLPQVAAQGHQHLLVEKGVEGEVTQSRVRLLEAAGRVQEIARMLGGLVITPQTLAHAEEMLMLAGESAPMVTS